MDSKKPRLRTDRSVEYQIRMLERKMRKLTKKFEQVSGKECKLDVARILKTGASIEQKLATLRWLRSKGIMYLRVRRAGA